MWLSAFLFLNVKTVIFFLVYSRALKYNKISFLNKIKAIIRKSANQMKVWDAKLQGL